MLTSCARPAGVYPAGCGQRRGVYALPTDDRAQQAARAHTAVAVLVAAAAHWQWPRKWEPRKPQLAVPRGRSISPETRDRLDVRWRTIPRTDVVDGWVTSQERTVLDCALLLPFDEALAVADSALRSRQVDRRALLRRVDALDPQLRPRARRVVTLADAAAANPFESVLRAIALDVPGLRLRTQVRIDDGAGWVGRVDLADDDLRIVLEADSMEYHGERDVMDEDCARYTRLVADGWLVLRFTWTQVMTRPDWVRARITATVRRRQAQCPACRAASQRCAGGIPTTPNGRYAACSPRARDRPVCIRPARAAPSAAAGRAEDGPGDLTTEHRPG